MNLLRLQSSLSFALRPLAAVYRLLMRARRASWESGWRNRLSPPCPCISVGNIAWGGTGKTPLTGWLMGWASRQGLRTVLLSRGYKADVRLASIYIKPHHRASEVGDEPLMLAQEHPEIAVLVDPDRRRSGRYALRCLSPDLMLLDDGFQHLPIQRDLDLVLLRPEDLNTEWNRVIPAGSWREGADALTRADAFLVKTDRAGMEQLLPLLRTRLARFQRPVFSFTLQPVRLEPVGPRAGSPDPLWNRPYVLITGVGNPAQVRDTVTRFLGHPPAQELLFPDHHPYGFRDVERLAQMDMPAVCTCKDAVKLRELSPPNLWALRVEVRFGPALWSSSLFPQWLEKWWEGHQKLRIDSMVVPVAGWTGFVAENNSLWEPPLPVPPPAETEEGQPETDTESPQEGPENTEQQSPQESPENTPQDAGQDAGSDATEDTPTPEQDAPERKGEMKNDGEKAPSPV